MSNPTEPVLNGKHDAASSRIAELEAENSRLRDENARLHARAEINKTLSDAYLLQGLPRTPEEYREMVAEARPFRELLEELERKHGLEHL
jgi:hypothetical protein